MNFDFANLELGLPDRALENILALKDVIILLIEPTSIEQVVFEMPFTLVIHVRLKAPY